MQIDRRRVLGGAALLVPLPAVARAQTRDFAAAADYSARRRGVKSTACD